MQKASYNVYRTSKYDTFRHLQGNRTTDEARVRKIMKSIQDVGYISNPIVVNERMEVVDGQGRLEALRRLGMPVEYIIATGANIKGCQAMNNNTTRWGNNAWIDSYADLGDTNYIYLRNLRTQFKGLGISTILFAVDGFAGPRGNVIKSGMYQCTEAQYIEAIELLSYCEKLKPYVSHNRGKIAYLYDAAMFAKRNVPECDEVRLTKTFERYGDKFSDIATLEEALDEVETYYNYKIRGSMLSLKNAYRMWRRDNQKGNLDADAKGHRERKRA